MKKIFQKDLIAQVCARTGFSRTIIEEIISATFAVITDNLRSGCETQITGFGKFYLEHRNARTGRNPHTGEAVPIPARLVPSFEAGKLLKEKTSRTIDRK